MYSGDNNDGFPSGGGTYSFSDSTGLNLLVSQGYLTAVKVFLCPSTTSNTASATFITTSSCDYNYAEGHIESTCTTDVSIIRDKATNHTRFGNLLFGDGHVKGFAGNNWLTGNSNF
jgi:prepilin-type processing-associated H-X9-DG protein